VNVKLFSKTQLGRTAAAMVAVGLVGLAVAP
jgi:hypothetical protein